MIVVAFRSVVLPNSMQRAITSETRRRLLDAGKALLFERGIAVGLRNVPITDVVARAGRSPGAAYQLWPRQALYHRELALEVVSDEDWADHSVLLEMIAPLLERGAGWHETFEVGARAYLDLLVGSRQFYVLLHFQAAALDDEELRAAMRDGYERLHQGFKGLYEAMMEHFDLQMLPGRSLDDFAVAATALTEGFALRGMVDPDRATVTVDRTPEGRSLYGQLMIDLVDRFVSPRS